MKILFINNLLGRSFVYKEPLGLEYLSAYVKQKNAAIIDIIDTGSPQNVFRKVQQFKPDLIAYSIRSGFHQFYLDLNRALKRNFTFLSVFGGPHTTFAPETINEDGVDIICRGEGEEALFDLITQLERGEDISRIENLWVKKDGVIFQNPIRPLVENLDLFPFPDRSLLDKYPEIKTQKLRNFITTRGCPYDCTYCFNNETKNLYKTKGRYLRRRSVDNVIEEIKEVKERCRIEAVHFEDDTFNLFPKWIFEFCEKYRRELHLPFRCNIRLDSINEEIIRSLKEAGCIYVVIAIESGVERVRKDILNRNITDEQILYASSLLKKYGIRFLTENMLAIPFTTLDDDLRTLDLNMRIKPDYPHASLFQPYPGTKLGRLAQEAGLYDGNYTNLSSPYSESPIKTTNKLERENLQKLFAIIVQFPLLRKIIRPLLKLRLSYVYNIFYLLWRPYCFIFRLMPLKLGIRGFTYSIKRYLRA